MAAAAEAEKATTAAGTANLGPHSGIAPATPDIVQKLVRQSRTTGADGSCCTALFTAVPASELEPTGFCKMDSKGSSSVLSSVEGLSESALVSPTMVKNDGYSSVPLSVQGLFQSLSIGPAKVESDRFNSVPSLVGEQSRSVQEDLGELDCAVSTQESSTLPDQVCESPGNIAQQREEGVSSDSDPGANDAVPTPDKVEPTPPRWRKKSIKGVPRFKVMKDKILKPKVTPKESTPDKVKKKKKLQGDGSEHVETSASNIARRKLDLNSSESKVCFSRATLMSNLRCLAKSRGLRDDPCARMRNKRGKKRKFMISKHQESGQLAMVPYQSTQTDASSSALVPLAGFTQLDIVRQRSQVQKLQTKVLDLDEDTLQVYDVLRRWDESGSESFEGFDIGSGPEWERRRHIFEQYVDVFIATMHDLLGPRKFSEWGGSVIDSVVGTFLTQNVADNLSSNAFMNLAAKFPPNKRCCTAEECSDISPLFNAFEENINSGKEDGYDKEKKGPYGQEYRTLIENFIADMKQTDMSNLDKDHLMNLVKDKSGNPICTEKTLRKFIATLKPETTSEWDTLREEAYRKGYNNKSETRINDAVDWESVLHAPALEVAKCIAVRGQHYLMACRIQAFLARIERDHGSFDLDWLRHVPRESAKNYLLSIMGLGDKSVDCICLLSLRHKAFPVDVNVARIVTRLGWVQLQPLEGSAEFHLVDLYPIMRDVQRYLWPRLCTIDKEKLYELHCLMITFGKVMCTKACPNCSACPFSAKCKYYRSTLGRLSLPPTEAHRHESRKEEDIVISGRPHLSNGGCMPRLQQPCQHRIDISRTTEKQPIHNCEPIIEVPPSPEHEYEEASSDLEEPYENDPCDLEDIVPEGVQYDAVIDLTSSKHMMNNHNWTSDYGKDLVLISPQCSIGRSKKLKNIGRLRTEHNAYILPDDHLIIEGQFEERVPEDPSHYLLVVISCPDDYTVKGTILVPVRCPRCCNFMPYCFGIKVDAVDDVFVVLLEDDGDTYEITVPCHSRSWVSNVVPSHVCLKTPNGDAVNVDVSCNFLTGKITLIGHGLQQFCSLSNAAAGMEAVFQLDHQYCFLVTFVSQPDQLQNYVFDRRAALWADHAPVTRGLARSCLERCFIGDGVQLDSSTVVKIARCFGSLDAGFQSVAYVCRITHKILRTNFLEIKSAFGPRLPTEFSRVYLHAGYKRCAMVTRLLRGNNGTIYIDEEWKWVIEQMTPYVRSTCVLMFLGPRFSALHVVPFFF